MQWADEDHQNAVQANADAQADRMKSTTGMTYTFVPNNDGGKEVLEHMGGADGTEWLCERSRWHHCRPEGLVHS